MELFEDAWGVVGHTKLKCWCCHGTGNEGYGETCLACGGLGWVCEEEEPKENNELEAR